MAQLFSKVVLVHISSEVGTLRIVLLSFYSETSLSIYTEISSHFTDKSVKVGTLLRHSV